GAERKIQGRVGVPGALGHACRHGLGGGGHAAHVLVDLALVSPGDRRRRHAAVCAAPFAAPARQLRQRPPRAARLQRGRRVPRRPDVALMGSAPTARRGLIFRRASPQSAATKREQTMDLSLKGKTALVTGASIGIGRGIAAALAREGARLAIVARRANLLEELAGEIVAAGGTKPVLVVEDIVQEGAPARIAKAALEGLGSVDILINNAGGSRAFKLDATEEQWHEAMTLNFTRQRQLTHVLLGQMIGAKWGRIITMTGKSEPEGINGAFSAKAAVHAWAKGLSREVGKHGITVN